MRKRFLPTVMAISIFILGQSQVPVSYLRSVSTIGPGTSETLTSYEHLPLLYRGQQLLVAGQLEGVNGFFILDTGSPTLVVHSAYTGKTGLPVTGTSFGGETLGLESVKGVTVRFRNRTFKESEVLVADLSHLEQVHGVTILGLLGKEWLDKHPFIIDLQRYHLLFLSKDSRTTQLRKPIGKNPITMVGHLPVIEVWLQGKKYHFGLDIGSSRNILDPSVFDQLPATTITHIDRIGLQGLTGAVQFHELVDIQGFKFSFDLVPGQYGFIIAPMPTLLTSDDKRVVGLIGVDGLKNTIFSIDYEGSMLFWWDVQ